VKIKNQRDFFAGLMFMIIGVAFASGATTYRVGAAAHMGAGYFPLLLGGVLALLGGIIMFKSLVLESEDGGPIGKWAWRPLFFIIAANLAFGVLLGGLPSIGLPPMGLVAAIYALTVIASMADGKFHTRDTLILATILAAGSYFAFILVLKLQMPVWPEFAGT
jgi:hypothetical protein